MCIFFSLFLLSLNLYRIYSICVWCCERTRPVNAIKSHVPLSFIFISSFLVRHFERILPTGLEHRMKYLRVIFDGQTASRIHFPIGFLAGLSIAATISNRMTMVCILFFLSPWSFFMWHMAIKLVSVLQCNHRFVSFRSISFRFECTGLC